LDIQQKLLQKIKNNLTADTHLVDVLVDKLFISKDAAYRRISGKVPFTLQESQILLSAFDITLTNFVPTRKNTINFEYKPLSRISIDFGGYLKELRDGLREIKQLKNASFFISINETPVFQLFNFPHLLRFKFFFWSKTYLNLPSHANLKFRREKIDRKALAIGMEAHNLYNAIPSSEIYCKETLQGILRQLEYYFEAGLFEDEAYVLELLDNVLDLIDHLKDQAQAGHKFTFGNVPQNVPNTRFDMYWIDTYLPDNTYYVEYDNSSFTYFTHNIMNVIFTNNPLYNSDTKMILDRLRNNAVNISRDSLKERDIFFTTIKREVNNLKNKIELELSSRQ
jgi:hypothetical protein